MLVLYGVYTRLYLLVMLVLYGVYTRLYLLVMLVLYGVYTRLHLLVMLVLYGVYTRLYLLVMLVLYGVYTRLYLLVMLVLYGVYTRLHLLLMLVLYGVYTRLHLLLMLVLYGVYTRLYLLVMLVLYGVYTRLHLLVMIAAGVCLFLGVALGAVWRPLIDPGDPGRGRFAQAYVEDAAYAGGDVAVLFLTGEDALGGPPTGAVRSLARNLSARIVAVEHRYYGTSLPYPLTNKEGLRFLTVELALADFAQFTVWYDEHIAKRPLRWIVMGGSYAGALSVWLRQKYPHRFLAAWSSSAPIKAILNFYEYSAYAESLISPKCKRRIKEIIEMGTKAWKSETENKRMRDLFLINVPLTLHDFEYMLSDAANSLIQYGAKEYMCNQIINEVKDPLKVYAQHIYEYMGTHFVSACSYSTICLSDPQYSHLWGHAGYAWTYQTCSQLGMLTTSFPNSVRSSNVTLEYFINQCQKAFYNTTYPDTYKFNLKYGGLDPVSKGTTRVIAFQSSDDPWQMAGVTKSLSDSYIVKEIVCSGCGHCSDLQFSFKREVYKAQQFGIEQINKWLNNPE